MVDHKEKRGNYRRKKRHRKRRRVLKRCVLLAAAVCFAVGIYGYVGTYLGSGGKGCIASLPLGDKIGKGLGEGQASSIEVHLEDLYSPYAVLLDAGSGEILGGHNSGERIYPASLTKIMTAFLAAEKSSDLDEKVILPGNMFQMLYAQDASMAGFAAGEEVSLRDLLYGVLLPSGAECCIAFAERIAGTESGFVELMNDKAKELGMDDTHFCNSTGLHETEHYSTARDMAVLLKHALQNRDFREAFCSSRHSIQPTAQHPEGFTFHSTMFKYMDSPAVTGGEILGGKTGYTREAGQCLASLASVNGKEYILVTAKADGSHETEQFHILDAKNVYSQIGT